LFLIPSLFQMVTTTNFLLSSIISLFLRN
jgi:hypothetical protein